MLAVEWWESAGWVSLPSKSWSRPELRALRLRLGRGPERERERERWERASDCRLTTFHYGGGEGDGSVMGASNKYNNNILPSAPLSPSLAARILENNPLRWDHINIPLISESAASLASSRSPGHWAGHPAQSPSDTRSQIT